MSSDREHGRQERNQPTSTGNEASRSTDNARRLHPTTAQMAANLPGISTYWDPTYAAHSEDDDSPIDPHALQAALPFEFGPSSHLSYGFGGDSVSAEAQGHDHVESDRMPLTSSAQPISRSLPIDSQQEQPRHSFQTVSDSGTNIGRVHDPRTSTRDVETGRITSHHHSHGQTLAPGQYRISRAPSSGGALHRAGSIMRAMSQRVVNISGESEVLERRLSRHESRSPRVSTDIGLPPGVENPMLVDTAYHSQGAPTPLEKSNEQSYFVPHRRAASPSRHPSINPLKGNTLGCFSSQNRFRLWLCDVLVNPYTEPVILVLIIAQMILLAVEAAPDVFANGGRPTHWGNGGYDWAMMGLFIVFTLELIARIIVSGLLLNAAEYSTIDRKKGLRAAIADQYRAIFQPQRAKSVRGSRQPQSEPTALARSFTTFWQGQQALPKTFEDQQRFQLARRAFLRHSFNRFDFLAVVAFWIDFVVTVTGIGSRHHLHVFKMISCLRILRLLAVTNGTAVILRSLKKATPLLVRVAFLISFFWLLFAIIGVQSFKASFSRQCVWIDPSDPQNLTATFTNTMEFCGGYLNNETGRSMPWVKLTQPNSLADLSNGTWEAKGFICPRGSVCLEQANPYSGTVNFDNIFHSLELVFVIMSANTFSDLMYSTMGSDYTQAALFFGAAIMIMTLWLTNLLIAVITSSFQVIREESKASAFTMDQKPFGHPHTDANLRRPSSLQRLYDKTKVIWLLVITFGLIIQACRSASMSGSRAHMINMAEIVITAVLDVEILIRIVADWRGFHRDWRNLLDLLLATATSVIYFTPVQYSRVAAWLSVFEIVRVYRIVLGIPVTRTLIYLVLGNATGIANLVLFVFLTTFLVSIFAAQLFRGEIPLYDQGQLNRISFYTIYNSFLGMYQVLTSENWTAVLYTVTSYTTSSHTSIIGAIFLIGWFVIAFFILINMFIAVIQENFDVSEDEKRVEQVKAFLQRKELGQTSSNLALSTIFGLGRSRRRKDPLDYGPAMMDMLLKDAVVREFLDDPADLHHETGPMPNAAQRSATGLLGDVRSGTLSKIWGSIVRRFSKKEPNPFYSNIRFDGPNDTMDPRQMARQAVSATAARRKAQREYLARYPTYNNSLYIFKPQNLIRRLCQRLVGPARGQERYDGVEPNKIAWYSVSAFIYAATCAMVVLACVTTPLYQKQYQEAHPFSITNWYVWTDLAFTVLFTFEGAVKVVADGLFSTPNAYLRSSWGIIDTIVLITLWINVVTLFVNDGAISRAVGAFKALRALRLLNVSDSARDIFHSLIIVGWWKFLAVGLPMACVESVFYY